MKDKPSAEDLKHEVATHEVEQQCPELLRQFRDGDRLWYWFFGERLATRSGYAVVREGKIVASCVTIIS